MKSSRGFIPRAQSLQLDNLTISVLAAIATFFLVAPLIGIVARANFSTIWNDLTAPEVREMLQLSVFTATISALICFVMGTPLAWALLRWPKPVAGAIRVALFLPVILPPVVLGAGMLTMWAPSYLAFLDQPLLGMPQGWLRVIFSQTYVAFPFYVIAAEIGFRNTPPELLRVASSMGANGWQRFRLISLPIAMPGITTGLVLSGSRAFGEFGATVTLAGQAAPSAALTIYQGLTLSASSASAVSLFVLVVGTVILLPLTRFWLGPRIGLHPELGEK